MLERNEGSPTAVLLLCGIVAEKLGFNGISACHYEDSADEGRMLLLCPEAGTTSNTGPVFVDVRGVVQFLEEAQSQAPVRITAGQVVAELVREVMISFQIVQDWQMMLASCHLALALDHQSDARIIRAQLLLKVLRDPEAALADLELLAKSLEVQNLIQVSEIELAHLKHEMEREPSLRAGPAQAVLWHVGQVIMHRKYGYRGVIIGWDPECNTSAEWIQQMGVRKLQRGQHQPFYQVLVDVRDRPDHQQTYVAEENLSRAPEGVEVQHEAVPYFFDFFIEKTSAYLPVPALSLRYPDDDFSPGPRD